MPSMPILVPDLSHVDQFSGLFSTTGKHLTDLKMSSLFLVQYNQLATISTCLDNAMNF
jgi:hypothetical protein